MENFTALQVPPEVPKQKKGLSKKAIIFSLTGFVLVIGTLVISLLTLQKPKTTKTKAQETKGNLATEITGRCGDPIEDLCINWTLHTNAPGTMAKAEISLRVSDSAPGGRVINNIWVGLGKSGCRGIKIICQGCQNTTAPMLHCPDGDPPEVPAENQTSEVQGPFSIKKGDPALTFYLEQLVDSDGSCGSSQVDVSVMQSQTRPPPYYDPIWGRVYWGIAYKTDANGNPLPCVSPTETPVPPTETPIPTTPPGEPTNTPVPTNTPTPTTVPTETPTPKACHQPCSSTFPNCQEGLECRADWCPVGQNCNPVLECTNPTCPKTTTDDCSCPAEPSYTPVPTATNTPTPTSTPTPTNTPTLTPTEVPVNSPTPTEIILAQNTPTPQSQSAAPVVTEIPSAGVPIYLKIFSGLSLGILLLGLLL